MSSVFDHEVFCDIIDNKTTLSKFYGAVGITTANT